MQNEVIGTIAKCLQRGVLTGRVDLIKKMGRFYGLSGRREKLDVMFESMGSHFDLRINPDSVSLPLCKRSIN